MLNVLRREPSAILLAAQLAGVLLYPFMEGSVAAARCSASSASSSSGSSCSRGAQLPGADLGRRCCSASRPRVLLLIQAVTGSDDLLPYSSALEAVLYFYAAGALIAYMLADHEITRDELFAVGATFTLVAWAFAYTFTVCQAIEPQTFTAATDPSADRTWMELLFLSFTTLTSTGLSDVVPVKAFAARS